MESIVCFGFGGLMLAFGLMVAIGALGAPNQRRDLGDEPGFWFGLAAVGLVIVSMGCVSVIRNKRNRAEINPNEKVPLDVRLERGRKKAKLYEDFARQYPDAEVVIFSG
jgi:hypothetical protein